MHIVTFFSFAGETIAFLFRLLGLFIMLRLVFLFWPEERGRGREGKGGRVKDPYRQREVGEFVIGLVDLERLGELGNFEGCEK